mgnify:CR=1 FL=1
MSDNISTLRIIYEKNKGLELQTICLWACYVCCALSGIVPQMMLSLIIVCDRNMLPWRFNFGVADNDILLLDFWHYIWNFCISDFYNSLPSSSLL